MNQQELVSFDNISVAFASRSNKELARMYLLFSLMNRKHLTKIGTKFVKTALKFHFPVQYLIRQTIFKQFVGGETIEDCLPVIERLHRYKIHTILDYSFEGKDDERAYDRTVLILRELLQHDASSSSISFSVVKFSSLCATSLLENAQSGLMTNDEQFRFNKAKIRFEEIAGMADKLGLKLLVDAEESWIQNVIDEIVLLAMRKYNKEKVCIFNTYQMYRRDMFARLENDLQLAKREGFQLGVKLVRGAYLEKEQQYANEKKIACPLYKSKVETDKAYNRALELCIENINHIELCCGTHNRESNSILTKRMEKRNIGKSDDRIHFAQLYGMSDDISYNLAASGYNVAKYMPFGKVEEVIPYLLRRAQENTAIAGQTSRELSLIKKEIQRRKDINKY